MLKLSGQVYLYRTFKNNEFDQSGQSPASDQPDTLYTETVTLLCGVRNVDKFV